MSNIELYNKTKDSLRTYMENDNNKLIILSGSGKNGKTTLLNELKDIIHNKKYAIINMTHENLSNLKDNFNMDVFNHLIFDVTANLDDFPENNHFLHLNMNNIHF